jgi:hypothetical protein
MVYQEAGQGPCLFLLHTIEIYGLAINAFLSKEYDKE